MTDSLSENLYRAFLVLESEEEVRRFMSDLMTPDEVKRYATRFEIMRLSQLGMTRQDIQDHMTTAKGDPPSLTTISRAKGVLSYGTGQVESVLKRLKES